MPEKTSAELRPDGYFITGDLGHFDSRGYTIVNAKLRGQIVKIRANGQILRASDFARCVTIDPRRIHLFDVDGERV